MIKKTLISITLLAVALLAFPQTTAYATTCTDNCWSVYRRELVICGRTTSGSDFTECVTLAVEQRIACLANCP